MVKSHTITAPMRSARSAACAVTVVWVFCISSQGQSPPARPDGKHTPARSFLEEFRADREAPIHAERVVIPTANGRLQGLLTRPATQEVLPALLLIPDDGAVNAWMKVSARELAGIGYEVLLVDLQESRRRAARQSSLMPASAPDERILSELSAALRWLRRRADVIPERTGVVGWGWGGAQALALAAAAPVQACVSCDASRHADRSTLAGLRRIAVLGVQPQKSIDGVPGQTLPMQKSVTYNGVQKGFMDPGNAATFQKEAADKAWVEIYNFLGKHVEDAPLVTDAVLPARLTANETLNATIFDIMLAVNAPSGVRGTLTRDLEKEPTDAPRWERVRANAALIAEAGKLLNARRPARGTHAHWLEQTTAYMTTAQSIATAAKKHDYAACRRGLQNLGKRCALCHEQHR